MIIVLRVDVAAVVASRIFRAYAKLTANADGHVTHVTSNQHGQYDEPVVTAFS